MADDGPLDASDKRVRWLAEKVSAGLGCDVDLFASCVANDDETRDRVEAFVRGALLRPRLSPTNSAPTAPAMRPRRLDPRRARAPDLLPPHSPPRRHVGERGAPGVRRAERARRRIRGDAVHAVRAELERKRKRRGDRLRARGRGRGDGYERRTRDGGGRRVRARAGRPAGQIRGTRGGGRTGALRRSRTERGWRRREPDRRRWVRPVVAAARRPGPPRESPIVDSGNDGAAADDASGGPHATRRPWRAPPGRGVGAGGVLHQGFADGGSAPEL